MTFWTSKRCLTSVSYKSVKLISSDEHGHVQHINKLLLGMFSLDEDVFEEVYQEQIKSMSFKEIFVTTYVPLLSHIGQLWQAKGVRPAQEHVISNFIYQKIVLNIAELPMVKTKSDRMNVLFLPEGEIHEIGLLFMAYYLKSKGEKTTYLGRNISFSDLTFVKSKFDNINWICSFVIDKNDALKKTFVSQMKELIKGNKGTCQIIGRMWGEYTDLQVSKKISFNMGFDELIN